MLVDPNVFIIGQINDSTAAWAIHVGFEGLATGSIRIQKTQVVATAEELYQVMQKTARFWEGKGITNYLCYTNSRGNQGWEMVPFEGSENSWWDKACAYARQAQVVSRVVFGRYQRDYAEIAQGMHKNLGIAKIELTSDEVIATEEIVPESDVIILLEDDAATSHPQTPFLEGEHTYDEVIATTSHPQTPFDKREVIQNQLILEGEHTYLLHDYAPQGKEGLHFLVIPKSHKERFSELSLTEFQEMQETAAKVQKAYPDHICYRFNKTGSLAGQTVRYFHEHLIFILPEDELAGQMGEFMRMVIPPTPLSSEELKSRIKDVQKKLEPKEVEENPEPGDQIWAVCS